MRLVLPFVGDTCENMMDFTYPKGLQRFMHLPEQLTHLDNGHTIARYRILYQDCNPQRHVHLHRLMALAQDSDDHSCFQ
jgi:hypothetical protein